MDKERAEPGLPLLPLPLVVVAAALTDPAGRVLVQRRPAGKAHAGLWEFPGGKVEPGETPEAALVRELREELGVVVAIDALRPLAFGTDAAARPLVLLLFAVADWRGEPAALSASALAWCAIEDLAALAMPPADRPLIAACHLSIKRLHVTGCDRAIISR